MADVDLLCGHGKPRMVQLAVYVDIAALYRASAWCLAPVGQTTRRHVATAGHEHVRLIVIDGRWVRYVNLQFTIYNLQFTINMALQSRNLIILNSLVS